MTYRRGTVVLVRFPFTDLGSSKQRPALVLATEAFGRLGDDLILAAITSARVESPGPFDHPLNDWQRGGLLYPSLVRAGKLVTLDRSLIRRALGQLSRKDVAEVEKLVRAALGLK